jgi:hypothetical protein
MLAAKKLKQIIASDSQNIAARTMMHGNTKLKINCPSVASLESDHYTD